MKVVINTCFGGFGLSEEAYKYLGLEWDGYGFAHDTNRTDSKLIECVETLGEKANGPFARLKVVEVPDDINWYLDEYDGIETVEEEHRSWN